MSSSTPPSFYLPLLEAQALLSTATGDVNLIEVFLDDADRGGRGAPGHRHGPRSGRSLTDWRQRNRTFFAALEVERNVMFIILTLIVLVAASTSSPGSSCS
jgi:lipoprotein-releasing system permease protein